MAAQDRSSADSNSRHKVCELAIAADLVGDVLRLVG
jgi:hypothetical protein